jgi:predicted Zn-dependent protease with MMP-like domain
MDLSRFERLVAEALDGLPAWVRERLDNVEVLIEDDSPRGQHLLGLYEGIPLTERGAGYTWTLPDRITLYRRPIEQQAGPDEEAVREVVAETVVHEVAHFFGIDDERLEELGRD